MSTDITIEAKATATLGFDDFARLRLDGLGRVASVLADDPESADAALTAGVQSVFDNWASQNSFQQAEQHVFAGVVRYCQETTADGSRDVGTGADHVMDAAIALAHHVFGWDDDAIERTLGLSGETTLAELGVRDVGESLQHEVAQAEPARIDLLAVTGGNKPVERRRVIQIAAAAVAALLALGGLAQFVARPDRTEAAQDPPAAVQEPPAIESALSERPSFPGENMVLEPLMPRSVRGPSLITSDGSDGFVGVRLPNSRDPVAVFLTSSDGTTWQRVGSWDDQSTATIDRLERMGDRFVVWSETSDGRQPALPRLAISTDLLTWSVIDLPVLEPQPFGLLYRSRVSNVVVQSDTGFGDTVLALITTDVEIDFAALSLSEGYTCGHSIADNAVTVNLCNSQLDVLSFSDVDQLPAPNRLFVSRDGQPFERTTEPFGRETDAQLALVNGAFAIADGTGIRFATSTDARTWQASAAQKPSFPVRMSAVNDTGQVLGVGVGVGGEPMLFFNNGPNTTSTLLNQIVVDVSSDATVLVAATSVGWAAYIYEPDGRAWIAASSDGLNWNVAGAAAPDGTDVELIASDDHALVRSTNADGTISTQSVPLP